MVNSGTTRDHRPVGVRQAAPLAQHERRGLAAGATATLLGSGTLGYEWDADLDNGARPAGLVDLSSTTVSNVEVLQDFGSNYGTGTRPPHSLTLYRKRQRARLRGRHRAVVVGTGRSPRSRQPAADPTMKQATVNLLADMGAQPGRCRTGSCPPRASTDTSAPTTASRRRPRRDRRAGSAVTVHGHRGGRGGGRVGGVEVSVDGGATWHPASGRDQLELQRGRRRSPGRRRSLSPRRRRQRQPRPPASVTVNVPVTACPCSCSTSQPLTTKTGGRPRARRALHAGRGRPDHALRYYSAGGSGTASGQLWTARVCGWPAPRSRAAPGWQRGRADDRRERDRWHHVRASYYLVRRAYGLTVILLEPLRGRAAARAGPGNGDLRLRRRRRLPHRQRSQRPTTSSTSSSCATTRRRRSHGGHAGRRRRRVDPGTTVRATFDEPLSAASVNGVTFRLLDPSGAVVPAAVAYAGRRGRQPAAEHAPGAVDQVHGAGEGRRRWHARHGRQRARPGPHVVVHDGAPRGRTAAPTRAAARCGRLGAPAARRAAQRTRPARASPCRRRRSACRAAGNPRLRVRARSAPTLPRRRCDCTLSRPAAATRTITVTGGRAAALTLQLDRARPPLAAHASRCPRWSRPTASDRPASNNDPRTSAPPTGRPGSLTFSLCRDERRPPRKPLRARSRRPPRLVLVAGAWLGPPRHARSRPAHRAPAARSS